MVTGSDRNYAAQQLRFLRDRFPAVNDKIVNWEFQGERQRATPVGDIYVVVELIMLLPGKRSGQVRREAASLLVRVYGGDFSRIANECYETTGQSLQRRQEREALPATHADEAAELCALLGVKEAVRIRTVGEGAGKLFSLVDVARLVSGKTATNAWRDVCAVMEEFTEVSHAYRKLPLASCGLGSRSLSSRARPLRPAANAQMPLRALSFTLERTLLRFRAALEGHDLERQAAGQLLLF